MSIQPLPPEVIAKITSSTTVTSLNDVVCELIKNSLDAAATKVSITIDYRRGACTVEDNGHGILPLEFEKTGGLGRTYHTSKRDATKGFHGSRGCFLAALSAVALTTIISRHQDHRSCRSLTMYNSAVVGRKTLDFDEGFPNGSHGTKVSVRDLFGAMPVRVKQRAIMSEKEGGNARFWERLRRRLALILLCWQTDFNLTLHNLEQNQTLRIKAPQFKSPLASDRFVRFVGSVLSQAGFITFNDLGSWVPVEASTTSLSIQGTVCLQPHATKVVQFLGIGLNSIDTDDHRSVLHDEINRVFLNSDFGVEEAFESMDETRKRLRQPAHSGRQKTKRKGIDRWPQYFLHVRFKAETASLTDDLLARDQGLLNAITELLNAMLLAFLMGYGFLHATRGSAGELESVSRSNTNRNYTEKAPNVISKSELRPSIPCRPLNTEVREVISSDIMGHVRPANSDLQTMSRIKKGSRGSARNMSISSDTCEVQELPRSTSAPPLFKSEANERGGRSSLAYDPVVTKLPLLSKTGQILRMPFDDIRLPTDSSHAPLNGPQKREPENQDSEFQDWTDPFSKMRSTIDLRTGRTVPDRSNAPHIATGLTTQPERPSSAPGCKGEVSHQSRWLVNMLGKWDNPVYAPVESEIPRLGFEEKSNSSRNPSSNLKYQCNHNGFNEEFPETPTAWNGSLTKETLQKAKVIAQVDNKFILVKTTNIAPRGQSLYFIDQHAADERIRIEKLLQLYFERPKDDIGVLSVLLDKSVVFEVASQETEMFRLHKQHFAFWGFVYDLLPRTTLNNHHQRQLANDCCIAITHLPPLIAERCRQEPRLLIELLRSELWRVHESGHASRGASERPQSWIELISTCPRGVLDMLNSRACRSAVMFNDVLSKGQCENLVRRLAECVFPFQCAHGRPSLVPLLNLKGVGEINNWNDGIGECPSFTAMYRQWQGLVPEA